MSSCFVTTQSNANVVKSHGFSKITQLLKKNISCGFQSPITLRWHWRWKFSANEMIHKSGFWSFRMTWGNYNEESCTIYFSFYFDNIHFRHHFPKQRNETKRKAHRWIVFLSVFWATRFFIFDQRSLDRWQRNLCFFDRLCCCLNTNRTIVIMNNDEFMNHRSLRWTNDQRSQFFCIGREKTKLKMRRRAHIN